MSSLEIFGWGSVFGAILMSIVDYYHHQKVLKQIAGEIDKSCNEIEKVIQEIERKSQQKD